MYVPLSQILHYRMIICEITVMDKCLMQPDKWVCAAGMPDPTFRRIAVMADPDVSLEIFQPVVLDNIISVANKFQNDQVLPIKDNDPFLLSKERVPLKFHSVAVLLKELASHL